MAYIGVLPRKNIGEEHGQALHETLDQFANYKFQEMINRNERSRLKDTYAQMGKQVLTPEENEVFSNILANTPQQEHSALMQVIPQMFEARRQQSQQQSNSPASAFQNFMGQMPASQMQESQMQASQTPQQGSQQRNMPQAGGQSTNIQTSPLQILSRGFETPALKLQREKEVNKERRFAQTQDMAQEKLENLKRPYIDKIAESETKNKESIQAYNQMEHLVKTDQVDDPLKVTGLQMMGLENYPAFLKPGSQEYDSLMLNFTSKIKDDFGARPTQWDAQQIFKRMATLLNTKEGKLRIIAANRNKLEAKNIINQQKREIIKENRGKIPADIGLQANERSEHKIDQLWNKYKQNLGMTNEQTFESLPNPSEYTGKTAVDSETGNKFISDGQKWIPQPIGGQKGM